jgi:hypothetical protein
VTAANGERTLKNDPLFYDLELPLRAVYHPIGFSVEIATNCELVLAAAEESWGHFRRVFAEPPVQLRIAVLEGGQGKCPPPPTVRGSRNLLVRVADAANFSVSNLELGLGLGWLTPAVIANAGYLRYYFLEGMCWDLLEPLYLTSIHAACVQLEDSGVLLCGDSGAGKSSLAFACARDGWKILSDDSTCLVRKCSQPVVVGNPYQIRFRDSAVKLFPELSDRQITRRLNGKMSIEVPTASIPGIETISKSSVDYIVFLKRGKFSHARLLPFPKETALRWFEQVVCYGDQAVREAQEASLLNLMTAKVFELQYEDLDAAVARLSALVRQDAGSLAKLHTTPEEQEHA